jgi:hypothetical protein
LLPLRVDGFVIRTNADFIKTKAKSARVRDEAQRRRAMNALTRVSGVNLAAAGLILCGTASALAGSPHALTDRQLDHVTAGGATVVASTDAQAAGVIALVATTGNSLAGQGISPYPGQPELGNSVGVADGTAVAVGTNLGQQGQPPASSNTAVMTAGIADGTHLISSTVNQTARGAGGVTFQAGWTFVYGSWGGL